MCDFPETIKNKKYPAPNQERYYIVPCHRCNACMKKRANEWAIRLHYQMKGAISAKFVTLTYAEIVDDNCDPANREKLGVPLSFNGLRTARKSDLQNYFKRLRKLETNNTGIKYYACSEYGAETHRPHYHIILFNVLEDKNIRDAWGFVNERETAKLPPRMRETGHKIYDPIGFVTIDDVNTARIRYVTGYIEKKIGIPLADYDDREREFSLMSKNMGISYVLNNGKHHRQADTGYTYFEGKKYSLPRYYKERIFPDLLEKVKEKTGKILKNGQEQERTKWIVRKKNPQKVRISAQNQAYFNANKAKQVANLGGERNFEKNQFASAKLNNFYKSPLIKSKL